MTATTSRASRLPHPQWWSLMEVYPTKEKAEAYRKFYKTKHNWVTMVRKLKRKSVTARWGHFDQRYVYGLYRGGLEK